MSSRISAVHKLAWATMAAIAIVATACSDPLDVVTTSRIPAENIETPANAQLLVDGAIADFECAFASYVVNSATVGEEFIYAQQTADRVSPDARRVSLNDTRYATFSCEALGIYGPLHTARNSAETVLGYLKGWTDAEVPTNRTNLIGISAAYAGYSYVLLGEGFCTMAVSKINLDRSVQYGGEIQRDSVFKLAIARFTEAIAAGTTAANNEVIRMSLVGRARAKLNIGDLAGARADAALVPSGFVKNATYSSTVPRRNNLVVSDNSVTNRSSSIGVPYRTLSPDPRVPVSASSPLFTTAATGIVHYYQTKYADASSPIPLATYEEAQLIIAEADIQTNTVASLASALTILNAERVRGSQGAFAGTTQAQYMAELIDQRRRELFLESHHLGDAIRYGIALTPAAGTAYHFGGGNYGTQLCFPLPASERLNNPLIGG